MRCPHCDLMLSFKELLQYKVSDGIYRCPHCNKRFCPEAEPVAPPAPVMANQDIETIAERRARRDEGFFLLHPPPP